MSVFFSVNLRYQKEDSVRSTLTSNANGATRMAAPFFVPMGNYWLIFDRIFWWGHTALLVFYRILVKNEMLKHFLVCSLVGIEIESAVLPGWFGALFLPCKVLFRSFTRNENMVMRHQNITMLEDMMTNSKHNQVKSSKLGAVTQGR